MRVLVTGGCGFLGTNMVAALLTRGHEVRVLDNLSRAGTEHNLAWLQRSFGNGQAGQLAIQRADVCESPAVAGAVESCDVIIHLAAQVAVTSSVRAPRADFEVNAL